MKKNLFRSLLLAVVMLLPFASSGQVSCSQGQSPCFITVQCFDDYGDGWNNGYISVYQGTESRGSINMTGGASSEVTLTVCPDSIRFVWNEGYYDEEVSFIILNGNGDTIYRCNDGSSLSGQFATGMVICPTCPAPSGLSVWGIGDSYASVSWTPQIEANGWLYAFVAQGDTNAPSYSSVYDTTVTDYTLLSNTVYTFYLKADCGGGDESAVTTTTFRTLCSGQVTLPYTTSFEGYAIGDLPGCWSNIQTGTSGSGTFPSIYEYSYNAHSGQNYFEMESSSGQTEVVAFPEFEEEPALLKLEFYARAYYGAIPTAFEVGVVEDDSTFVSLQNISLTTSYQYFLVYFGNYDGDGGRIAFRTTGASSYTVFIDDISVTMAPNCLPVTGLTSTTQASDAIELSWTPGGSESSWTVAYSTTELDTANLSSANTETAYAVPYTVSNLTSSTNYYFYVRANCGSDGHSEWAGPYRTRTTLDCNGDTYFEGVIGTGGYTTSTSPIPVYYQYSYQQELFTAEELQTLNLYSGNIHGITIDWASANTVTSGPLYIYMANTSETSLSSGFIPDSALTLVWSDTNFANALGRNRFDFPQPFAYTGGNVVVCFASAKNTSAYAYCYAYYTSVADGMVRYYNTDSPINFDSVPATAGYTTGARNNMHFEGCSVLPSCVQPNGLTITGTSSTSVDLTWTEIGTGTSWNIYYDTVVMDDNMTGTIVNAANTSETVNGLTTSTGYYFYVRTDCGSEQSPWVGPVYGMPGTYEMRANHNDTIVMCGGTILDNGGINGNYAASQTSTLVVYSTDTASMGVSINGTLSAENSSYDYLIIYDGVGTAGTVLFSSQGLSSSISSPMTVSATSLSGPVTIYFRSDGSVQGPGYELNVTCYDMSCSAVSDLTVDSITAFDVTLDWTPAANTNAWQIQYHTSPFTFGDTVGTILNVTSHPATVAGLTPNTRYYFAVATDCGSQVSLALTTDARTACYGYQAVPYTTGFEDVADGELSGCWDAIQTGTSGYSGTFPMVVEYSYNAHAGSKYFEFESSSAQTEVVALPVMDSINTLQIEFYAATYSYYQPSALEIGVMEGNTFVPVDTVTLSLGANSWSAEYFPYTVYLNNYTGTGDRIAMRATGSSGQYTIFIDDLTVSHIPACLPVSNIALAGNTSTSVTVTWNTNGTTAWNVVYDTVAITDFSGYVSNPTVVNSFTANGLTAGLTYYFYIQSDCGAGALGDWIGPFAAVPGTWVMHANQTDTVSMCGGMIYDDGGADGNYSASQTSYLVVMPDQPMSAVSLNGTVAVEGYSYDNFYIYDGIGTSGTELVALTGSSYSGGTTVSATSTTGPLTIKLTSDGSVQYGGFALQVSCVSNSCPAVSNIRAIAAGTTSIDVTWDTASVAMGWELEYGLNGYTQGTGTSTYVANMPYTINGLDTLTAYDVYVRPICSVGDTGTWAMGTVMTSFCDNALELQLGDPTSGSGESYSPVSTYYNFSMTETIIDSAEIAMIGTNEISAVSFYYESTSSSTSKTDVTIWLQPTTLSEFGSSPITLDTTIATQVFSGSMEFEHGWNTFLFDNGFNWSGTGNVVMIVDDNSDDFDGYGYNFRANATASAKTFAYMEDYDDIDPMNIDPDLWGDAYDFRVVMKLTACGVSSCRKPNAAVSGVTYEQATLTWSGTADSYEVSYRPVTQGTWEPEVTVNNAYTYTLQNLYANTNYQARVRAICDAAAGEVSDWSIVSFLTDSLPCFAPTNIQTTPAFTTIAVDWTAGSDETHWAVRVFNTAFDSTYMATAHPFTATALNTNTTYNVTVQALCGNNGTVPSDNWSDTVSVTTDQCDAPTNLTATVNGNSAVLTWTPGANNNGNWVIEYGRQGFASGNGTTVNATSNTTTITGLEWDEDYDVYVRANCETGAYSTWSNKASFTTPVQTGIADVDAASMSIYPNPATGSTSISLSGVSGNVRLMVVDMNGRTVRTEQMTCDGTCVKVMDVEGLASGAYFVRVMSDNFNTVKKLIVK